MEIQSERIAQQCGVMYPCVCWWRPDSPAADAARLLPQAAVWRRPRRRLQTHTQVSIGGH